MKATSVIVFFVALSSFAASAQAESLPPPASSPTGADPGGQAPERHHTGFFLRTHLGAGYREVTARSDQGDFRAQGAGAGTGLSIGGAIARDLVLYGDAFYEVAEDPTFKTSERSVTLKDAKLNFVAVGPGISYYLMPANVHFGVLALLCKTSIGTKDKTLGTSEWGMGGAIRVGKDFWVAKDFGLGALAQVSVATMKDRADSDGNRATLNSTTATFALEMTYH